MAGCLTNFPPDLISIDLKRKTLTIISSLKTLRIPFGFLLNVFVSAILHHQRSFREDARRLMKGHISDFIIEGESHLIQSEPCLLVVNHFYHPGFNALWIAVAIASVIPQEMQWLITNAWTFPRRKARSLLRNLSHFVLSQIASVYHFFPMPPNPPELNQSREAALTIRKLFQAARTNPRPFLAFAPEGRDFPNGTLGMPAKGTGTIIAELCKLRYSILPVGFFLKGAVFHIVVGKAYHLEISSSFNRKKEDPDISTTVMQSIARLLPIELQGNFSSTKE